MNDWSDKPDRRWWQHKKPERCHDGLWKAYTHAKASDKDRPQKYRTLRSYYADGVVLYEVGSEATGRMKVSRHNMLASVCDTAATKVLDHRPDPKLLTSGGSAKLRKQAKDLSVWTGSVAEQEGLYDAVETAGAEAILNGTGAYRTFERKGKPAYEVVYCDHVVVDPLEAYNDAVMTYYWERYVDRSVLLSMFPEAKKHILKSPGVLSSDEQADGAPSTLAGTSDMILVVHAYRVAMSDEPGDEGRFCIAVEHGLIHDEPYESEDPPFTFIRWRKRPRSFWGIGVGELLAGIQDQLDRHTETIDESLDAMPASIWVQGGSVKRKEIDDGIARIYEYDGTVPPQLFSPAARSVEGHTAREQYLGELVYHLAGVSSMEAGAQKEPGLNSGRAILAHANTKSGRLKKQIEQVEQAYTDGFRRTILVADKIVEGQRDKDHKGRSRLRYLAGKGKRLKELDYPDIRLRDTLYRVSVWPISKLPDHPSGRMEAVSEMANMGAIPPEATARMLDFPDLEAFQDEQYSRYDHAHFLVEMALEGKNAAEWLTSDDDLAEVMRYGQQMRAHTLLSSDADDPDEAFDDIAELRQLLAQCATLQSQAMEAEAAAQNVAQQSAVPPMPAGPGAPPPAPAPMPMPMPIEG